MKPIRIILIAVISSIVVLSVTAQDKGNPWEEVDKLVNQGLNATALDRVDVILQDALSGADYGQAIKALLYKTKLRSRYQEEYIESSISEVREVMKKVPAPAVQVLHSVLAELYWKYYQANRFRFLERTPTTLEAADDIRAWDLQTLFSKTADEYLASLEDRKVLQQTPVGSFKEILIEEEGSEKYRPTLYDFLAHRALDFFMNQEAAVTRAEWQEGLKDPDWFAPAERFSDINFEEQPVSDNTKQALAIFRELIAFHLEDNDPAALIDADLKRVLFVRNISAAPDADRLYESLLVEMQGKYQEHPLGTEVSYQLARFYHEEGGLYDPFQNEGPRWLLVKAREIAEKAIDRYPESYGATRCRQLVESIDEKDLGVTLGYGQLPGQPMLGLLEYRNISTAWFRIIRVDSEDDRNMRQRMRNEELMGFYLSQKAEREWKVELPGTEDFQSHSAQVDLGTMPLGYYVILVSDNKDFRTSGSIAYNNFWSTRLSFINETLKDGSIELYVLDRESGERLPGVTVKSFTRDYNYSTRQYRMIPESEVVTDATGYVKLVPEGERRKSLYLNFILDRDTFITQNYFYQYRSSEEREPKVRTWFFTDRSIYRPGQKIYYKGIMLKGTSNDYSVVDKEQSTVAFYDVNGQEISTQQLSTNEFGTFQGSFTAPSAALTGQMRISNGSGSVFISVEEYQRPTFEVKLNPLEGAYRLDEMVTVSGNVRAYAGNPVDHASLKYRVVRRVAFPFRMGKWYWPFPQRNEVEVTSGEVMAGDNGEFSFTFLAVPDHKVDKKYNPVFNYDIVIDATDITGETRSKESSVTVGYKSMFIEAPIPENIDRKDATEVPFRTTNLNGRKINATGTIEVFRLKSPGIAFRDREWPRPDQFIMQRDEFRGRFPADVYNNEDDPYQWERQTNVFTTGFKSSEDSIIRLGNTSTWDPGEYILVISSTDPYGEPVSLEKVFTVFSTRDNKLPIAAKGWFHVEESTAQPGEEAIFLLGSAENVKILFQLQQSREMMHREWISLEDEVREIRVPVTEAFRGNVTASFSFVKDNRSYQFNELIKVERSEKKLDMEVRSFRSKLYPGEDEQWSILIHDLQGGKVTAELLASMYDASLDQIKPHDWPFSLYTDYGLSVPWKTRNAFSVQGSTFFGQPKRYYPSNPRSYDRLNWFGFNYFGGGVYRQQPMMMGLESKAADAAGMENETARGEPQEEPAPEGEEAAAGQPEKGPEAPLRRNFNETAFFYPQLRTNQEGEVVVSFQVPESLTEWRFMALAHTRELQTGYIEKSLVTQKELMVIPNPPRFVREGDKVGFSVKVVSLSGEKSGTVSLELLDPYSMESIAADFGLLDADRQFNAAGGSSDIVTWELEVPSGRGVFAYRVIARSGQYSDGEERAVPVLPANMLVTESMNLPVNGKGTREFTFENLVDAGQSPTLQNYRLTLQFSSNPAWYAVLALPYLREGRYDNAENIFSRFYANALSSYIAASDPKIRAVYEQWQMMGDEMFESQLSKNEELKNILLEESPWVMDALREKENRQDIAILFDENRMKYEQAQNLKKLVDMQLPSGAWPWFTGMRENRYMTQYIVTGMGKLDRMGVSLVMEDAKVLNMARRAIYFLDKEIVDDFERTRRNYENYRDEAHLSSIQIHYLYARSFFNDRIQVTNNAREAYDYYVEQARAYWLQQGIYEQGLTALALYRLGDEATAEKIAASIKDNALYDDEMGMYWRSVNGFRWNEAGLERQALLIELFEEVLKDHESVEKMKVWLLKQKQTQAWETSRATAEAVYALLLRGTTLLSDDTPVSVTLGGERVDPLTSEDILTQAGTGYFETFWEGDEITPDMGRIQVTKKTDGIAWGGIFWQYYEDLDKIGAATGPLSIQKELYIEENTPDGPVLHPVTGNTVIHTGDQVVSRIVIRADRDLEYVHVKDMRAATLEPENMISGYRYQDRLGYYESPRDASTNFFMDYLRKGTYVLEYRTFATRKGTYSNGISTIQCLYAPEFSAHSEGVKIVVE